MAHGADAFAAARCAWGAEGSLGQRPNVPEAGERYKLGLIPDRSWPFFVTKCYTKTESYDEKFVTV